MLVRCVNSEGTEGEIVQGSEYFVTEIDVEYDDSHTLWIIYINDIGYGAWRFEVVEV